MYPKVTSSNIKGQTLESKHHLTTSNGVCTIIEYRHAATTLVYPWQSTVI